MYVEKEGFSLFVFWVTVDCVSSLSEDNETQKTGKKESRANVLQCGREKLCRDWKVENNVEIVPDGVPLNQVRVNQILHA
jgi:hypothetical protein